ncbi:MAG: hypothetical protein LYZ70_00110 [Nitrososphaerales archaeon]|nr:hypothetical protein [Nitrososphaerales archaeon]
MPVGDGEPLELCEECGSPLEDGVCGGCGPGFRGGASPVGAAPPDRRELSKILGRNVGARAHGSYALSMQQEKGMAPLRKEIGSLVERFNASPEVKASVRQNAERLAVKIMDDLGPTKAAIVSVTQEFIRHGRTLTEVASCISQVHAGMDKLRDLVVEVYPAPEGKIRVLVDGSERPFRSYTEGLYRKLRIPLFASDGSALFELRNARLTTDGYDPKRVEPRRPTEFVIRADDRSFELFKVLKEARLSGGSPGGSPDPRVLLRKYSVSKLPLTERLLREAGVLQMVNAEYAKSFAEKLGDGRGRSPRKLAEMALFEVCDGLVPRGLRDEVARRHHLRPSALRSLVVKPELAAWQG